MLDQENVMFTFIPSINLVRIFSFMASLTEREYALMRPEEPSLMPPKYLTTIDKT